MNIYAFVTHIGIAQPFPQIDANATSFQNILSIVLGVVAAITVIFLIINALRYMTSVGDPQANARLRNSIIYGLIGLAVVITAEFIVNFVISRL